MKQKYPFPIIEDCLAHLGSKSIFTLLDLKDGFHHRPHLVFSVHDCLNRGYFQLARAVLGEAPAEFQKRLVMILNFFIRQGKIIVYIDDILISSSTIQDNLNILKEVLIELKRYDFQLNLQKCF